MTYIIHTYTCVKDIFTCFSEYILVLVLVENKKQVKISLMILLLLYDDDN